MTDTREKIMAAVRAEFLNAISNKDFEIEHKVDVHEKMGEGGKIDYLSGIEEFKIKSVMLKRKTEKETGAFCYSLKIVVE